MKTLSDLEKCVYNDSWISVFDECHEKYGTVIVIEDGRIVAAGNEVAS